MACTHGRQSVDFPVSRIAAGFPDHPGNDRIIFRLDLGRIPFSALHPAGMDACQGQENGLLFSAAIAAIAANLGYLSFAAMGVIATALGA